MKAKIIDGRQIAKEIREEIKSEVEYIKDNYKTVPGLAVVMAGDDGASSVYVSMKERACKNVGFHSEAYRLPEETTQEEIIELIDQLNKDVNVHGILVQLPLPKGLDENFINSCISPSKDIDGFHAINTGNLVLGEDCFEPCTPKGIIELIKRTGVDMKGKHAVVVGRSNIVGKPTAMLLLRENATVTICHSKTTNLSEHLKMADIVVAAVGVPELIKGNMIKEGAVVIDAGTRKVEDKLVGDVEYEEASKIASWITPVPGGVGPMTIAMLLKNTLKAAKNQCE